MGERLCPKILGNNEVSTNESFQSLDYAWLSYKSSTALILELILEPRIETECPHTSLEILLCLSF
jgi:hypothetical protein